MRKLILEQVQVVLEGGLRHAARDAGLGGLGVELDGHHEAKAANVLDLFFAVFWGRTVWMRVSLRGSAMAPPWSRTSSQEYQERIALRNDGVGYVSW